MPQLLLDVPDYTPEQGMRADWDKASELAVRIQDGEVFLQGNVSGLRSLARLLVGLNVEGVQD
jgi:hypothetical protein